MYEEFAKRLRQYAATRKGEIAELTAEAADVIEEMSHEIDALNDLITAFPEPPKEDKTS